MSNNNPIFPISESHHFTDYTSDDHQIPYFQVLEEARNYRRDNNNARSINFKLQKPISKDESKRKKKQQKRNKWWKNAIMYFRNRWSPQGSRRPDENRRRDYVGSISGPVYLTESRSGSNTPSRNTSRPLTPARKGEVEIPYFSLRELNMDPQFYKTTLPIYSVT
ncbi:uncharacterized protein LOC124913318 [Impatiens glandulifera]|uniref:uncharacterized protein LOC124913318 n=1 Tax=Impatiens glandulifera TaxID=253017 RepID=UPI001FB15CB8|nr:uncharacterized protein LOC124913318 [Impatiens glandulifera]